MTTSVKATRRRWLSAALALLTLLPIATAAGQPGVGGADEATVALERALTRAEHPWIQAGAITDVSADLAPLYAAEPDHLLWFVNGAPLPALDNALAALAAAGDHGLEPAAYDADLLRSRWAEAGSNPMPPADRVLFDLALSVACARLMRAVHVGRVDPATLHWGYTIPRKSMNVVALFRDIRLGAGLGATLDRLQPGVVHYQRARSTLARYRALARAGEPEAVPRLERGPAIKPGTAWTGVPQLVSRLRTFGDLTAGDAAAVTGTTYAAGLVAAVKAFQGRHGLEPDGVIGAGTIAALNVPVAQRVRQIELAMERMRWLPDLGSRPNLFVNVPLFRLWATDPRTGAEPLRMNVVVGQALNHKTPLFVEQLEYVIFRPYWNPPYGITVKELVPRARRDASYLDRENLEIVASGADDAPALPATAENLNAVVAGRLHLRQRPGPGNSLGLAKFMFPNAEAIYMHGTPAQQLFSRTRRDFSHGCIRLETPAALAEWVLRDHAGWTRARIDEAMQGARPTRVDLKDPVTVVLFYDTVHVNSENVVHFVDDIYGHDRTLEVALAHGYPYPSSQPPTR